MSPLPRPAWVALTLAGLYVITSIINTYLGAAVLSAAITMLIWYAWTRTRRWHGAWPTYPRRSVNGVTLVIAGIFALSSANAGLIAAGVVHPPTPDPERAEVAQAEEPSPANAAAPTPTPTPAARRVADNQPKPTATPTRTPRPTPTPEPGSQPTGTTEQANVVSVVDGDTIEVSIDGQTFTVRYIGIDTPETVAPGDPVQWMGPEAADANRQLLEGETVVLERDVSETDQYDRLLRYVWIDDGGEWILVNLELVRGGFAEAKEYPPDVKYSELLDVAEADARAAELGIWGTPPAPPPPPPTPTPAPVVPACDPSYPTLCLPVDSPVLTCPAIGVVDFPVAPPDRHGFDGDLDGIGCETPPASPPPAPAEPPPPASNCHPSYAGACLLVGAGDYDCAGGSGNGPNYTGTVQVVGYDEFDLDADGDGLGCE